MIFQPQLEQLGKTICIVILLILVPFYVGCAVSIKSDSSSKLPTFITHTVKFQRESFGYIAVWYTGNQKNWEKIAAANPLLKPNRIKIGQKVLIPSELVTRTEPMPEKFLRRNTTTNSVPSVETRKEQPSKEMSTPVPAPEPAPLDDAEDKVIPSPAPTAPDHEVLDAIGTATGNEMLNDSVDASVESLLMEPTPGSGTISPDQKAREDLIDEILR